MATTEMPHGASGSGSQELLSVLEPEQLTGARRVQLPRRDLKGSEILVVWGLRLYLFFMIGVVIYQMFSGTS